MNGEKINGTNAFKFKSSFIVWTGISEIFSMLSTGISAVYVGIYLNKIFPLLQLYSAGLKFGQFNFFYFHVTKYFQMFFHTQVFFPLYDCI